MAQPVDYNLTQKLKLIFDTQYKDDFILGKRTTKDLMPEIYKTLNSYFDAEFMEKIDIDYYDNQKLLTDLRANLNKWNMGRNFHQTNELTNVMGVLRGDDLTKYFETVNQKYFQTWLDTEIRTMRNSVLNINAWHSFPADAKLQYSTAGDYRVRDEHIALDGMVLPKSDPRWSYLAPPPSSTPWNCRCRLIPVWENVTSTNVQERVERMAQDQNKSLKEIKSGSNAAFSGQLFAENARYIKDTPDWVYTKLKNV
jgi:SPP1 gp7 family putative phage head morphogenesis protein